MEALPFDEASLTPVSDSTVHSAFSSSSSSSGGEEAEEGEEEVANGPSNETSFASIVPRRRPGRPKGSGKGSSSKRLRALQALFDDPDVAPLSRRHASRLSIPVGSGTGDFHRACRYGQLGVMRTMLRKGEINVNCHDAALNTPLHEAVLHNQAEAAKLLLKSGANPLAENLLGEKPIALSRSPEITALLRDFASYAAAARKHSFLLGCWRGDRRDIRAGAGRASAITDALGNTGLHYLAVWNNLEAAQMLLAPDAPESIAAAAVDIDRRNSQGNTPLYEASRFSSLEVIRLLLDAGASYAAANNQGVTPLSFAAGGEVRKVYRKFARERGPHDPVLLRATETKRHFEQALESSDDAPHQGASTFLSSSDAAAAAEGGRLAGMSREERKLQQMLAIFNRSTSSADGTGPVQRAEAPRGRRKRGRPRRRPIEAFTDEEEGPLPSPPRLSSNSLRSSSNSTLGPSQATRGRKPAAPGGGSADRQHHYGGNLIDKATGRSKLHKLAARGKLEEMKHLLAAEPGLVTRRDNAGYLALHEACLRGKLEVAMALLDAGSPLDVAADNGDMPLHDAASNGHGAIVELLLRRGADPAAENGDGSRPVDLCPDPATLEIFQQYESTAAPLRRPRGGRARTAVLIGPSDDVDSDYLLTGLAKRRSNRLGRVQPGGSKSAEDKSGTNPTLPPPPAPAPLTEIISSEPVVQLHFEGDSDDETGWYFLGPQLDSLHRRYISTGKLLPSIAADKQRELSFTEAERLQGSALAERLPSLLGYFQAGSTLLDKDAALHALRGEGLCMANVPVVYVDMARLSSRRPSSESSRKGGGAEEEEGTPTAAITTAATTTADDDDVNGYAAAYAHPKARIKPQRKSTDASPS